MAKDKKSLPNAPEYQEDPTFRKAFGNLAENSQNMATLNLANNPALLETIQFHPEMLDTFMNTLKTQMTPQVRDSKTQLAQELANYGALESSTTASQMGRIDENFLNTLQVQSGQFGLETMMKALENRISITNMGMQGLSSASGIGSQMEANRNQFNLTNYENQVAQQLYQDQNKAGGWGGAAQGAMGGAMAGAPLGPYGMIGGALIGGVSGYFSPSGGAGSGGNIMNMGLSSAGSGGLKGLSGGLGSGATGAGTTASNNLFRSTDSYNGLRNDYVNGLSSYGMSNNYSNQFAGLNSIYGGLG